MPRASKTVQVLEDALDDLRDVANYSRLRWGQDGRDYVRSLRVVVRNLWRHRDLWRYVQERDGYFRLRYEKHSVYFTIRGTTLTVRAILHTSMDPDRHL